MDRIEPSGCLNRRWQIAALLAAGLLAIPAAQAQESVEDVEELLPETVVREVRRQPDVVEIPREEETPQLADRSEFFRGTIFDSPFQSAPTLGQGYGAIDNTTGAKISIANIEYPGIVNVVPQDVLSDQQDITTAEALRNVPGAYFNTAGGRSDNIILRGFNIGTNFRKDGLMDDSRVQRDMANIDRVEVLKGPASFLYGAAANPSGTINYITKRPLATKYQAANMQFGYFDLYRFTMDDTGPLAVGACGDLLYRVNVAAEHANSFRDFVYEDRWFFAPTVTKAIDVDTTLTFAVELLHDNRIMDRGIPIFNGDSYAVPFHNFLGQPQDRSRFANERFSLIINHSFNDDWQMRTMYGSCWSNEYRRNTDTRTLVGTTGLINRQSALQSTVDSAHDGVVDITGNVEVLGMQHRLLFGSELSSNISNSRSIQPGITAGARINIFDPVYNFQIPNLTLQNANHTWTQNNQYAGYFQDFIEVNPYLKFLLGARYTAFESLSFSHASATAPKIYRDTSNYIWMPRYGVVLEPIPETLSFYCAYAESFNPVLGTDRFLNPLKPEKGNTYEYGVKFSPRENLQLGFGYYYIERTNITQADPNPLFQNFSIQLGMAQSQGIEFSASGELSERWDVIAAYSVIDTAIIKDTALNLVGNHLLGVPTYNASIWSRYNLIECEAMTVGVAVGPYFMGEVYADNTNRLVVPPWLRWDAGFFFKKGRLGVNLYFENLGDVRYINAVQSATLLAPGAPFNIRGMLSWTF